MGMLRYADELRNADEYFDELPATKGELVAFGDDGRPDFHLLRRKRAAVVAFVFDILESDGADLR